MDLRLTKIDEFIQKHLEQDFSLTDISNHIGYSPYHLSREFKKLMGKTLMEYVKEKKIMAAASKIAKGESMMSVD